MLRMPAIDSESDSDGPFSRLLAKRKPVQSESSGSSIAAATKQRKLPSSAGNSRSQSSSQSLDNDEAVERVISPTTSSRKVVVEINESAEFDAGYCPEIPGTYRVVKVLRDQTKDGISQYEVRYGDGYFETVSCFTDSSHPDLITWLPTDKGRLHLLHFGRYISPRSLDLVIIC